MVVIVLVVVVVLVVVLMVLVMLVVVLALVVMINHARCDHINPLALPLYPGPSRSIKLNALPRLIALYREQFMTSYRPPARPPQSGDAQTAEQQQQAGAAADKRKTSFPPHAADGADHEHGRRRKCTSFAGLPSHRHPGEHRAESRMRRFSTVVPPSQKVAPGFSRG